MEGDNYIDHGPYSGGDLLAMRFAQFIEQGMKLTTFAIKSNGLHESCLWRHSELWFSAVLLGSETAIDVLAAMGMDPFDIRYKTSTDYEPYRQAEPDGLSEGLMDMIKPKYEEAKKRQGKVYR